MPAARRVALALLVGLLVPACANAAGSGSADVEITLKNFSIHLSRTTVRAGTRTFEATNEGPTVHEFEILSVPNGVDPDDLPVSDNVADTGSGGLKQIDEVEDIAPSTTASLTTALEPGSYVVICNLPGHYKAGMHATFTVT